MTAKEDLFVLIKSLSKTEKAYFKKYTSIHSNEGKQQYLALFDLLNEMDVYDEHFVKQKMEPLGIKQLSVYKNYLYKTILRSQAQYSRTQTENHYLDELILEINVLMAKNLFSQCTLLIHRAKNLAKENENYASLLKVINLEIRFIKQSPSVKNWHGMYETAVKEEADALKKIQDIAITRDLNAEMFLFLQSNAAHKEDENVKQKLALLFDKLNAYTSVHSSAECAINHLSAYVNYYKFIQKPEMAYPYQFQAIEIFEEKQFLILNDPLRYVNSLSNLLILEMMKGDADDFMNTLDKLKSVETIVPKPLLSPNLQLHIFSLSLRHELSYYVRFEKYNQGLEVIQAQQKHLLEDKELINEIFFQQIVYYNARIYFGLNQTQKVNHWLQYILQSPVNPYNQKFHLWAKMLQFLTLWKDDNYDFIKSLAQSIQNFVAKYKIEADLEIYLVKKLLEMNKKRRHTNNDVWNKSTENLNAFLETSTIQENYFDYVKWWNNLIMNNESI